MVNLSRKFVQNDKFVQEIESFATGICGERFADYNKKRDA